MQRSACVNFAKEKKWKVTQEFSEKLSGFQVALEERGTLKKILQAAEKGEFDILLMYHSDRLGRQIEYSLFITNLYELGIEVWSVKEGELKNDEHTDSLINYLRFWSSEGESRKTSMRVQDSMRQFNEEGYYMGGAVPYGYKIVDTGKKRNSRTDKTIKILKPLEEESHIVKKMFSLVLEKSYGASRIAQYLHERGYTNRGNVWRHNTISRMLRNPIYMGRKRYNVTKKVNTRSHRRKETSRDNWKLQPFNPDLQIVDEITFEKVQKIIDKRTNNEPENINNLTPLSSNVLLSGLVVCGYCNRKLNTNYAHKYYKKVNGETSKYKVYRYECRHAKNLGKSDTSHEQKQFGAKTIDEKVEKEVMLAIGHLKLDTLNEEKDLFDFQELNTRKRQLSELEKKLKNINTAYNNTTKLFDQVMMGQSNMSLEFVQEKLDQYGEEKVNLVKNIDQLKRELKETEIKSDDLETLKQQLNSWVSSYKKITDIDEKKSMLGQVLEGVIVKKDDIIIKFNIAIEKSLLKDAFFEELGVGNDSHTNRHGVESLPPNYLKNSYDNKICTVNYNNIIAQWKLDKTINFEHHIDR